jgi:HSP20 family protein
MLYRDQEDWFEILVTGSRMWMEDIFNEYYDDMREEIEIIVYDQPNYEEILTVNYLISPEQILGKYEKCKGDMKENVRRRSLRPKSSGTIGANVKTKVKKPRKSEMYVDNDYGSTALPFDIESNTSVVDKNIVDIIKTNREIKLIVQIPLVNKNDIKLAAYDDMVEIFASTNDRAYHKFFDVPPEADIRTIKSNYNNGVLEITFSKKGSGKTKRVRVK